MYNVLSFYYILNFYLFKLIFTILLMLNVSLRFFLVLSLSKLFLLSVQYFYMSM